MLAALGPDKDATINQVRSALSQEGLTFGFGKIQRFFARNGVTQKKTAHATEQNRPNILTQREAWRLEQSGFDPARLVFIDETWASTNMVRRHGRCPRGERLQAGVPHGHWKTTTFVGALTLRGFIAPWVLNGPINSDAFETYVERCFRPRVAQGRHRRHGQPVQPKGLQGTPLD